MPRRNKVASLVAMPIAALVWCIGWGLYFVGSKKQTTKLKPKLAIHKELVMFVPIPEQNYAT
jgi:hypothetical protein